MYFKYDLKIGSRKNIMCLFIIVAIVVTAGIAFHFQIAEENLFHGEISLFRNIQ